MTTRVLLITLLALLLGAPGQLIAQGAPAGDDDDSAAADDDDSAAATPEDAERIIWEWMTRGYAAKRNKDWDKARSHFGEAERAGGDRYLVALELGYVEAYDGKPREAQRHFVAAAGSPDPDISGKAREQLEAMGGGPPAEDEAPTPWEWMTRAYAAERDEDWPLARSHFEAAEAAGADRYLVALKIAYAWSAEDDPDAAAASFLVAIQSPDDQVAGQARDELIAMGVALPGDDGDDDGVEKPAGPPLPLKAKPVMKRAWLLKEKGDFEGARTAFAEALELGVDEVVIIQELAWLALAELEVATTEERTEDAEVAALAARGHLLALVDKEHDLATTQAQLGYLALAADDDHEAARRFEAALEAGADPKGIGVDLGFVLLELEAPLQAETRLLEAMAAGADLVKVVPTLAFIAVQFDDPAEARRLFEAALAAGAPSKDLSLPLARVLISLLALEEAQLRIDEAEEAEADPLDVAETRVSLSLAWLKLVRDLEPDEDAPEEERQAWVTDRDAALQEARDRGRAALDAGADPATAALQLGYLAVDADDFEDAHARFEQARLGGADQQTIALALGYLASKEGDYEEALARFRQAMKGQDEQVTERAQAELAPTLIALSLERRAAGRDDAQNGRRDDAREAFASAHDALDQALDEGAEPRQVGLYRAYLEIDEGKIWSARARLREVRQGDDDAASDLADGELKGLPRLLWGDVYADAFAWYRFVPAESGNLVPTLRVRGYLHPIPYVDLDFYLEFRISRDVASRSVGPLGYPEIYADNTAMLSIGAQFRFWKKRVGLFVQAGPVFNLVDDGANRVAFDFRAGAFFAHEWLECRPEPDEGARLDLHPCADVYSDLIYVSRFNHNLFLFARGRFALGYLVTGPVSWAPVVEGRFLKDIRNDYYNNLVDVGIAHRWRLLKPFGLDFLFGIHTGTYFGLENVDPAPSTLGYVELRWQLSTYISF